MAWGVRRCTLNRAAERGESASKGRAWIVFMRHASLENESVPGALLPGGKPRPNLQEGSSAGAPCCCCSWPGNTSAAVRSQSAIRSAVLLANARSLGARTLCRPPRRQLCNAAPDCAPILRQLATSAALILVSCAGGLYTLGAAAHLPGRAEKRARHPLFRRENEAPQKTSGAFRSSKLKRRNNNVGTLVLFA